MAGVVILVIVVMAAVAWFAFRSQREGLVHTALPCPHCGVEKVELAVKVGYIRGLLLMCRYGSAFVIGCRPCVRNQVLGAAGRTLALGWWCYPWGVATPFVVLQNIAQLMVPPPGLLREALQHVGIAIEDVSIDADGLTSEQRAIADSISAITARLAIVGPRAEVRETGAAVLAEILEGSVSKEDARVRIDRGLNAAVSSARLDERIRVGLLKTAVHIACVAGRPSAAMLTALEQIAAELGFDPLVVRGMAGAEEQPSASRESTGVQAAARLLGVSPDASPLVVRAKYRQLMLKFHPDHAEAAGLDVAEATRRAQEINQAYQVLMTANAVPA
jgi:hypothetical protein